MTDPAQGQGKSCREVAELVGWNGPGSLDGDDRAQLAEHLADCERCSARVGRLWAWLLGPWPLPAGGGAFTLQRDSTWKVFTAGFLCALAVSTLLLVTVVEHGGHDPWPPTAAERPFDGRLLEALAASAQQQASATPSLPQAAVAWLAGWNLATSGGNLVEAQALVLPSLWWQGAEPGTGGGVDALLGAIARDRQRLALHAGELLVETAAAVVLRLESGGAPAVAVLLKDGAELRLGYLALRPAGG